MNNVRSLVADVEHARQRVLDEAAGLSTERGAFKPAPSEWSIAECLEHLFLAEHGGVSGLWKAIEGMRARRPVWCGDPSSVDGQHRFNGLRDAWKGDPEFTPRSPVMLFFGLDLTS